MSASDILELERQIAQKMQDIEQTRSELVQAGQNKKLQNVHSQSPLPALDEIYDPSSGDLPPMDSSISSELERMELEQATLEGRASSNILSSIPSAIGQAYGTVADTATDLGSFVGLDSPGKFALAGGALYGGKKAGWDQYKQFNAERKVMNALHPDGGKVNTELSKLSDKIQEATDKLANAKPDTTAKQKNKLTKKLTVSEQHLDDVLRKHGMTYAEVQKMPGKTVHEKIQQHVHEKMGNRKFAGGKIGQILNKHKLNPLRPMPIGTTGNSMSAGEPAPVKGEPNKTWRTVKQFGGATARFAPPMLAAGPALYGVGQGVRNAVNAEDAREEMVTIGEDMNKAQILGHKDMLERVRQWLAQNAHQADSDDYAQAQAAQEKIIQKLKTFNPTP